MPRYLLTLEFDGTNYCGWQRQPNGPTVQAAIEAAGEALTGAKAPCYGAGRTDSGVHAIAMSAHIDLIKTYEDYKVMDALNAFLCGNPIAVLAAQQVPADFHARFSCTARHYHYRILNRRSPAAIERAYIWRVPQMLDTQAMHKAAQALVGKHNFTTFRSVHCQADSPLKTLSEICVIRTNDHVDIYVKAPSFLHNQVRSIVGSLVQVGIGKWQIADFADALHAADRDRCGTVAPAHGLYFVKADYPPHTD